MTPIRFGLSPQCDCFFIYPFTQIICLMSRTSNRVLAFLLPHGTGSEPCIWLLLLLPQHIPVVGSIFGDSFYDQQLALRQTNALSHQVCEDGRRLEITHVRLSRLHAELCFCFSQLEQFNMIENPISSTSLYNQCSTLNYTQAAMMGLTGSSLQDSQQLGYGNHGNIPNIILTGSSTCSSEAESLVTFYILQI